jgi:uncharacterized protein (UPF0548 family)
MENISFCQGAGNDYHDRAKSGISSSTPHQLPVLVPHLFQSFQEPSIMRIELTNQLFTIPAGQAFSAIAKRPQTLRIDDGKVWITVEGSLDDHWLSSGERLTLEPGRMVVIEADQADSRIAIQAETGSKFGARLAALARRIHLLRPLANPNPCHCS